MARSSSFRFLVPMIVACALFMENLDATVIVTALPVIAQSLHVNPLHLNLAITSYLLSLAVFIPVSGWMADRFGACSVFRLAIVVFTLASVGCGLVTTLEQLVAARILQGAGGAMMVPVGRLVMIRAVPKVDLVSAMAYLTTPALIGPVIGPLLGGMIATYFNWRWIFFINVPIGVIGIILVSIYIDNERAPSVPPLDWRGLILTSCGLVGVMVGFETVGRGLVPYWVNATAFLVGGGCLILYYYHARRAANPVIDLSLLRIDTFRASVYGASLFRVGIGALPYLLPLMLQLGFGLTPLSSGMLTFASAAGAMLMKTTARVIIRSFGFRRVLIVNAALSSLFIFLYGAFDRHTPHWIILVCFLAGGFFRSLQFTSSNVLAFADVPPERISKATSFASMAQQLSITIGIGTAALSLWMTLWARGQTGLTVDSFTPAFLIVGGLSLSSCLFFARLDKDAGSELSGRVKGRS